MVSAFKVVEDFLYENSIIRGTSARQKTSLEMTKDVAKNRMQSLYIF